MSDKLPPHWVDDESKGLHKLFEQFVPRMLDEMTNTQIAAVTAELLCIETQILCLERSRDKLACELAGLQSRAFIEANNITMDDVELSWGKDGQTYYGDFDTMREVVMKQPSQKRFCEWNGRLYFTTDMIAGRYGAHTPGRLADVPQSQAK